MTESYTHTSISFDRAADIYDASRGFPEGVGSRIAAATTPILPGSRRVLEIGIGTGRISIPLLSQGIPMFGVDLSSRMLSRLLQNLPPGLPPPPLAQADACRLPFSSRTIDAVLAVHVFHLVSDADIVLNEIQRVLKSGGSLLLGIDEHSPDLAISRIRQHWRELVHKYEQGASLPGRWEFEEVQRKVESSGFENKGKHLTATWRRELDVSTYLEHLEQRYYSATWKMTESALAQALAELRSWIEQEYGSLNFTCEDDYQFVWTRYQIP